MKGDKMKSRKGKLAEKKGQRAKSDSFDSNAQESIRRREHLFTKADIDLKKLTTNKASFTHVPMKAAEDRADNGSIIIGELSKIFQVILHAQRLYL
jgi:hypothetical protein